MSMIKSLNSAKIMLFCADDSFKIKRLPGGNGSKAIRMLWDVSLWETLNSATKPNFEWVGVYSGEPCVLYTGTYTIHLNFKHDNITHFVGMIRVPYAPTFMASFPEKYRVYNGFYVECYIARGTCAVPFAVADNDKDAFHAMFDAAIKFAEMYEFK